MTTGNPFAQLIAQANKPRRRASRLASASPRIKPTTKTGAMRAYLQQHSRATAAELAIEADLQNTGLVQALLKADLAKGAVERRGNHYVWNEAYDESRIKDIQAAIRLLRSNGYSVLKKCVS